jgi:hypothetical protein
VELPNDRSIERWRLRTRRKFLDFDPIACPRALTGLEQHHVDLIYSLIVLARLIDCTAPAARPNLYKPLPLSEF